MSTDEISEAIGKIMENPEFVGLVRELRGDHGNGDGAELSQEMLTRLPEVLSMLGPMLGAAPTTGSAEAKGEHAEEPKQSAEHPPLEHSAKRYDKAKAEKLMFAIKPYLKPGRCEIIDKCMSAMQLTDAVEILKNLEGLGRPKT